MSQWQYALTFEALPLTVSVFRLWLASVVLSVVVVASEQFQILKPVIIFDLILVMNYFFGQQIPLKMFFHHKPMLKNAIVSVLIWMIRRVNHNVSALQSSLSVFPPRMILWTGVAIFRFLTHTFSSFSRKNVSFPLVPDVHSPLCAFVPRSNTRAVKKWLPFHRFRFALSRAETTPFKMRRRNLKFFTALLALFFHTSIIPQTSFFNSTPIVQPNGTGTTVGFTAGAGTNVTDASTFTGNVGSTAYRISDIVKALKDLGLIAQ